MYENISKNFNYWPKVGAKVLLVYFGFCVLADAAVLVNGFSVGIIRYNYILGLVIHLIAWVYFANALNAQKTLKNAYIAKVWRKNFNFTEDQVESALAQLDKEVTKPFYSDTTTKNTFMITQNWIIGATGGLMRAVAIRLKDIKEYESLVVAHHRKGATSYAYYLVVKNHDDKKFDLRFGSEEKMNEADYELNDALKKYKSYTYASEEAVLEESVFIHPQYTDYESLLSDKDRAEVVNMLKSKQLIQAIKYVREVTGLGLKEAKELVEKIQKEIGE